MEDIADFMNMEDEDRVKLVPLPEQTMQEVAEVCNRYPNLELLLPNSKRQFVLNRNEHHLNLELTMKRDISEDDFETKEEYLEEL